MQCKEKGERTGSKDIMICLECGQARRMGDWLQVFILARWQVSVWWGGLFILVRWEGRETCGKEKGWWYVWNAGLAREGLAPGIHPMSPQWTIGCLSDAEFHRVRLLTSSLSPIAFWSVLIFRWGPIEENWPPILSAILCNLQLAIFWNWIAPEWGRSLLIGFPLRRNCFYWEGGAGGEMRRKGT